VLTPTPTPTIQTECTVWKQSSPRQLNSTCLHLRRAVELYSPYMIHSLDSAYIYGEVISLPGSAQVDLTAIYWAGGICEVLPLVIHHLIPVATRRLAYLGRGWMVAARGSTRRLCRETRMCIGIYVSNALI